MHIERGDQILFQVDNDRVYIQKIESADKRYLQSLESTLEEWNSKEDEEAYHDL